MDFCVWNPEQDRPLLHLRFLDTPNKKSTDGDWIAWTPEGFYACTPASEQKFGFLVDQRSRALPRFVPGEYRKSLDRPDVIQRRPNSAASRKPSKLPTRPGDKRPAFATPASLFCRP